jgi:peptidyl-prolyl cis-trans isomerase B (cyclophilin B)
VPRLEFHTCTAPASCSTLCFVTRLAPLRIAKLTPRRKADAAPSLAYGKPPSASPLVHVGHGGVVSGKQHKRELRQQKEAAKAAIRRQERQRTIVTAIVIAVVVALGCVLVFLSLDPPAQQTKQSASATAHSEASVACGAAQPSNAGTVRPVFPGGPTQVMELGKDYRAVIQTSCGRVVVDLYEHTTPVTVNNFLFLAQHKFFDGLQIFRNAKTIGALQTGSGTNNAAWDVGYTIPDELKAAQSEGYPAGSVAMANTNTPNSAGSQFFFV